MRMSNGRVVSNSPGLFLATSADGTIGTNSPAVFQVHESLHRLPTFNAMAGEKKCTAGWLAGWLAGGEKTTQTDNHGGKVSRVSRVSREGKVFRTMHGLSPT